MTRLAEWVAAMFGIAAATVAAYAAIAAFRDGSDFPAAVFAVVAVMWALDAHAEIADAKKAKP